MAPPAPSLPTGAKGPILPQPTGFGDSRSNSPGQITYRPMATHTPSSLTCIAVITLLLVHASNGQDITTEGGDLEEKEQMEVQLPSDIQPNNIRGYHVGDSLKLTCTYLEKYQGQEPVTWRTLPDEKEITEAHEIRGGTLLFKQINTNLTGVFCLVRQGSLSWREEFYLRMLDPDQEAPSKILTELPSNVEAYSCEDMDTQPVAWINLAQLQECQEENFASYRVLKN